MRTQVLLLGIFVSLLSSADEITLQDGRMLECIIQQETRTSIRVDVGSGTMTFPKQRVTRIQRADESGNRTLKTRWNEKAEKQAAFENGKHANLARQFEALCRQQSTASAVKRQNNGFDQAKEQHEIHIKNLSADIIKRSNRLTALQRDCDAIQLPELDSSRKTNIEKYNRILSKKNQLQNQCISIISTLQQKQAQIEAARQSIQMLHQNRKTTAELVAQYTRSLHDFSARFLKLEKQFKPRRESPEAISLYKRIHQKLIRFQKEISSSRITTRREGNSLLVSALVNGTSVGDFIFDTGATSMLIHESFAKKLGIRTDRLPLTQMVVVGGAVIQGKRMVLKSVQVGDEVIRDVPAVLIPDSPNEANDGLLGMSFLRHFSIHLHGDHGGLELMRLNL